MLKSAFTLFMLPVLLLLGSSSNNSAAGPNQKNTDTQTETVEKLIIASGNVTMDLDLSRLNDAGATAEGSNLETLRFAISPDSFFTIIVTNDLLRGPMPGSIGLIPQNLANLPQLLAASLHQLVLEKVDSDEAPELVIRDDKTKLAFFNIEGCEYDYDAEARSLNIKNGRLLVSEEFAKQLGLPWEAQTIVGKISVTARMQPIEIKTIVDGEVQSATLPALHGGVGTQPDAGATPGPDVIVGNIFDVTAGTIVNNQVGVSVGTDSCNPGTVDLDWFALPSNDHPVIPQNIYRMSGGAANTDRFEQIGQSWLKHAFTAASSNSCGFGCNGVSGTHLGSGCSDLYSAGLNAGQTGLGSRAWVNPFTGLYPRGDSGATNPNNHTGHSHTDVSHRAPVNVSDLNPALNSGATYFFEGQYVTPHEYVWCQANPTQCNQYNNASYRRFNVTFNGSAFSFAAAAATVQKQPAIQAWTGATITQIQPAPGVDGIGFVGYKVTNPSTGVWHYEYAVYNQNLDRAIGSFSVPVGPGTGLSNIGFHAPPQEPGWANDGTVPTPTPTGTPVVPGYSSEAWSPVQGPTSLTWASQTIDKNIRANAIRWGTLYNFRFDSDRPPQAANATIGFFKTGSPLAVGIQAPLPATPTPTGTPTPSTPTPTPTPPATPTPTPTPSPSPSPSLVAMVSLPTATIDTSVTNFTQPVVTSAINASDGLVGFQGDFTFDETVVTFQSSPVSAAGLTANNWNVLGNVIPGGGPIRTLRISAFSNDFNPLSGSGTLFNLNLTRVSSTPGTNTALTWAPPENNFIFIDSNLDSHAPDNTPAGSITIQAATVSISGTISYCSNPAPGPVAGVTLTLTGSGTGSTLSDGSGNYTLSSLTPGGSYTVTPTKAALTPGSTGITTVDVIAIQRHFLNIGTPLSGCRLTAADVNNSSVVDTIDVIAVQRFFLALSTGIANTGKYQFNPVNLSYPGIVTNQTGQNYDALIFGDVTSPFVH